MEVPRAFSLRSALERKSLFLFGARQTGKTWLIRNTLSDCRTFNLLDSGTFLKLSRTPERLREELRPEDHIVAIDEIQKLPNLLDEVHLLIEERGIHFLLTGSSARKLRRGGFNLLGGRARTRTLHPFIFRELGTDFNLLRALTYGLLPGIYLSNEPWEDLQAYCGAYLQEEVAAEAFTRNIPAFSRFLQVAAICNGKLLNYTNISNDAQVARNTVQEYFAILKDTLLAFELPAWKSSVKRKPLSTSKLYFFDIGVARFLQNRSGLREGAPEFGEAFESYLFHELRTYLDYRGHGSLSYWRSKSGFEVDFIIDDTTAVEVKSTRLVHRQHLKGLQALREEGALENYVVVCLEDTPRVADGIEILPWQVFLARLWEGAFTRSIPRAPDGMDGRDS